MGAGLEWSEYGFSDSTVRLVAAFDPREAVLYLAAHKTKRRHELAVHLREELIMKARSATFRVVSGGKA